jgi:hydrogenase maturation protein HypF
MGAAAERHCRHGAGPSHRRALSPGLASGIVEMLGMIAELRAFDTIALSGGCFQNAVLFSEVSQLSWRQGYKVLSHAAVPANDGGLALGQAAIAAARLIQGDA